MNPEYCTLPRRLSDPGNQDRKEHGPLTYHMRSFHRRKPELYGLNYKCVCSCGKEVWLSFDDLFWGTVTSCGCKPVRHFSEDLTGRTFGQLTVIREVSPYLINGEPKERRWLTKCSCGRESIMLHDNLLQGKSKTCGCGSGSLSVSAKKLPSLVGQTFSSLIVVEEVAPTRSRKGHISRRFLCECECGNLTICKQHDLRRERATSCGCKSKSTNPHTTIDLTGRRFGKLTVISEADNRISPCGKRTRIWNVVCECGTKRTYEQGTLLYNKPLSCGCDRLLNPVGEKYGFLTVVKELEPLKTGRRRRQFLCKCECGNTIIAPLEYLTNGHKTSCGCKNRRNLTGSVFGDLTVLEETETLIGRTGKKYRQWKCICSCGKLIIADQYKLTYGMKTHCGCKAKQLMDLTGQRFGRNTVLREIESSAGRKRRRWLVRCDCGTIRSIYQDTLVSGGSKSCGCTRQSRSRPSTLAGNNKHQLILPFAPESE